MGINSNLINKVTAGQQRNDLPEFRTGDTVRVDVMIKEGTKQRIQAFEGFVLKTSGQGNDRTFTVRKESFGIGVERTFALNSPLVTNIEVLKAAKVRQSRIFFMRDRQGKSARLKTDSKRNK